MLHIVQQNNSRNMNACCVYDFTDWNLDNEEIIRTWLKKYAKAWTFQEEPGDKTGRLHYQGRFSLKLKKREGELAALARKEWPLDGKFTITSNENKSNTFYVTKEGRTRGPWTDKDVEKYVPRQFRNLENKLYPWQQYIWDTAGNFDPRKINVIIDKLGCQGKSTIRSLIMLHKNGYRVPSENDGLKCIQSVCDMLTARQDHQPGPMFIDLPRAMEQKELYGLYRAIETIKDGHVYELRNRYSEWWFDSPQIWVFTNTEPPRNALTGDRWIVWTIGTNRDLISYNEKKRGREGETGTGNL